MALIVRWRCRKCGHEWKEISGIFHRCAVHQCGRCGRRRHIKSGVISSEWKAELEAWKAAHPDEKIDLHFWMKKVADRIRNPADLCECGGSFTNHDRSECPECRTVGGEELEILAILD